MMVPVTWSGSQFCKGLCLNRNQSKKVCKGKPATCSPDVLVSELHGCTGWHSSKGTVNGTVPTELEKNVVSD